MAITATGAADSTSTYTAPSNIKTTAQAKKDAENAILNGDGGAMGQSAFLTLFTTQLQNQNPLDPMNNEAFVSQLAQFSQLEATTKMSDSLGTLVSSMTTDRMTTAASLIGKKVSVPNGQAFLNNGEAVAGSVALENDVDNISIKVYAADGSLIRSGEIGAQKKGEFPFTWDGMNDAGTAAVDGKYRIEATITRFGAQSKAPVSTLANVRSITTDAATGDMQVELGDGSTMSLSEIKRVGG
jgi:flagellar basal-body rod modification protein FlgD